MQHFGHPQLDELDGPNIHRTENIITLSTAKHHLFDRLQLWLEPTVGCLAADANLNKCLRKHSITIE